MVRNLGLLAMLATAWAAPQATAAMFEDCGPYYCASMCPSTGGGDHIIARGCDECTGSGCLGGGNECDDYCFICAGDPEAEWDCI
jgi:hypothetical protein